MTQPDRHGLSARSWANVEAIMPKIQGQVEQRKIKNNTNIDLSTAENHLIRPELMEICKDAISKSLSSSVIKPTRPSHFSYPRGFSGDPDLLEAYARFFNNYFSPHVPVLPSHLATAPGAAGCIDALLFNICEAGDGILMPSPYWNGFDFSMRVRAAVEPVLVHLPSFGSNFTDELLDALEEAIATSTIPIKALMITNPHNPLAVCCPRSILERCLVFCKKHKIHFISDEVYALTRFESVDLPSPEPFVSVLSLDLDKIGADKSKVHVVWSTSKDFGQSGVRMGCTVTQNSEEMVVGLALAANTQISSLSTIFVTHLLTSPQLPSLVALNSIRLASAYEMLVTFLKKHLIPYIPCNAGLYVLARLAADAKSWEDEAAMATKCKDAGVLLSPGRAYHGPEDAKGWMRIGFSVETTVLQEALRRLESVLAILPNDIHLF
ncbi:1-aminocyclopropane-1-carboxylate synthase [Pestalotiopsis sp. NC0098]|nr:1-aminocyclopropane-1-carboxylate synthase [Pestalotiopsis sp. NC0098]